MKILIRDLEANVANDIRNYERAMGRKGCATMKDNGERLLDIYTAFDFAIAGTLLSHRDVYKLT